MSVTEQQSNDDENRLGFRVSRVHEKLVRNLLIGLDLGREFLTASLTIAFPIYKFQEVRELDISFPYI